MTEEQRIDTEYHIAWMREHVRCESCKWFRSHGILDDDRQIGTNTDGNCLKHIIMDFDGGVLRDDGCSTHWEPKD